MQVVTTRAELAAALATSSEPLGLVPTMGALHEGHVALIRAARAFESRVAVSIFVNPLQFAPTEDLERYPRPIEADLWQCEHEGVDVVWTPTVADMYPKGTVEVSIEPGPLGQIMEGEVRQTHFGGMLTVVAKLLNTFRPHSAYFGEKDYQQLVLVRRMVADLDLGVAIVGVATERESDGLARSSRNVYLSESERITAAGLYRALLCGAAYPRDSLGMAQRVLKEARIQPDYLALHSPDLGPAPAAGPARLLVAARIGSTRLIDNIAVTVE
jgi:pantoate--beta-alanine ligase